jgi:quercetin dioxygenase-like cupin family protein
MRVALSSAQQEPCLAEVCAVLHCVSVLIAIEPGSYIRPHVHPPQPGWTGDETLAVLSGSIAVLHFSETGRLLSRTAVTAGLLSCIPGGQGHGVAALASGTVVLEIKPVGRPVTDRTWLPGFPAEEAPAARAFADQWQHQMPSPDLSSLQRTDMRQPSRRAGHLVLVRARSRRANINTRATRPMDFP